MGGREGDGNVEDERLWRKVGDKDRENDDIRTKVGLMLLFKGSQADISCSKITNFMLKFLLKFANCMVAARNVLSGSTSC